ncbi:MAG: trypsin-like peptidase domain-containing protein [Firmicutes bacterium]|nr:trypsin-like peptidase domain-containing protein [Bacillota bacterium]
MNKRIASVLLTILLCISLIPCTAFAHSQDLQYEEDLAKDLKALGLFQGVSDTNFALDRAPTRTEAIVMLIRVLGAEGEALKGGRTHPFTDVAPWADDYIAYAFENKLTDGVAPDRFGTGSASAAMYLTFVLRALGYSDQGGADFTWNNPYNLAVRAGILPDTVDTEVFLRADVVQVSYAALGAKLKDSDMTLADKLIDAQVFSRSDYEENIDLSKVGIVSTSDQPPAGVIPVKSEEPASPETPQAPAAPLEVLNAKQVFAKCSDAVFYIEVYDSYGDLSATGSGFFIGASGTAVTNYHVLKGASSALAVTSDGTSYDIEGIYDFSEELDLALIKVGGSGFPVLEMGDPSAVVAGEDIFAIGSPLGYDNTISQGIISNARRTMGSVDYIQFTAAISSGSSGGALINEHGQVIGVTAASDVFGEVAQNVNFAIPVNLIAGLSSETLTDFSSLTVVPEAYILASMDDVELQVGETVTLNIFQSYDYDATLTYYPAEDEIVRKSWGEWSDHYNVTLSLTGTAAGSTSVIIVLTDSSGLEMDACEISVTVTQKAPRPALSFSNPSPSVKVGETAEVLVTQNLDREIIVHYNLPDDACVSCEWGEFIDTFSCPLYITGVSKGRSWVQIVLYDENEKMLTTKNIYVTVE